MILLKLLLTFAKIGLFSFGGGYAMIPMIQKEIEAHGWLNAKEFADIIAISEMTPGPISVNSATFVGYKTGGFFGGMAGTLGVALPSFILTLIVTRYFMKFQEHPVKEAAFYGIRPVIAAMVITAALFISETAIFNIELSMKLFTEIFTKPTSVMNFKSLIIMAGSVFVLIKYKLNPILIILCSGFVGILLYLI